MKIFAELCVNVFICEGTIGAELSRYKNVPFEISGRLSENKLLGPYQK